jgi:PTH1 family peptidyl-tRNA hydrolase
LGNPGQRYARTRHNAGFLALEELAARHRFTFKDRELYRIAKGSIGDQIVILLEPLTFMNRSGLAVREALRKHNAAPETLIVFQDDIDMETGKLRIRKKGSSGGHKGIESLIQEVGTKDFVRIKIGVGRDPLIPVEAFVLSKFRKDETPAVNEALQRAADAAEMIIASGVETAMNRCNM